jgi:RNA polymerase primary sigma factor
VSDTAGPPPPEPATAEVGRRKAVSAATAAKRVASVKRVEDKPAKRPAVKNVAPVAKAPASKSPAKKAAPASKPAATKAPEKKAASTSKQSAPAGKQSSNGKAASGGKAANGKKAAEETTGTPVEAGNDEAVVVGIDGVSPDEEPTDLPAGEEGAFVIADDDEEDAPAQQVSTAGATADPVKDYLKQIGKVALLNAEQEVELAKRIEAGLFSEEKLNAGEKFAPKLKKELDWIAEDGRRAKNHLLEANLRLVVSLAKRYTGRGMLFLDLNQ